MDNTTDKGTASPGSHSVTTTTTLVNAHANHRHVSHSAIAAFLPNRLVSRGVMRLIVGVEALLALLFWIKFPNKIIPRPDEVLVALKELWLLRGLGPALIGSFQINLQALLYTSILSLGMAYLTVIPAFRPIVAAISKGRFLSLAGFTFVLQLLAKDGHAVKVWLLVIGTTVFYLTSMAAVVSSIPKSDFDYARTLRMSEWRVVWEVVILGTADKALEVLRQNAAMGWMMVAFVESITRSEEGVGTMLLSYDKYNKLPYVFAIQFVILLVGLFQDYAIGLIRKLLCPYADLTLERK